MTHTLSSDQAVGVVYLEALREGAEEGSVHVG